MASLLFPDSLHQVQNGALFPTNSKVCYPSRVYHLVIAAIWQKKVHTSLSILLHTEKNAVSDNHRILFAESNNFIVVLLLFSVGPLTQTLMI